MVTETPRPPDDDEDEDEEEENYIMQVLLAWVNNELSTFDADIYLQLGGNQ